ncbi:hypothetical protein [Croceimicrobium hydrocarbonivorans]|uniref:Uncharacterized protein n=1 Tax=Croceimicrobium hydrocarbonivorans TaxID=2761580 RepID=A0A7H0VBW6_9FLAO|nr:hypothetical protein [Croceimicrobium hydrocarbonivorans]QNR23214.1 hypothetical protein H4K34_12620 [Croceimicrobium hydrocarbonivorans]
MLALFVELKEDNSICKAKNDSQRKLGELLENQILDLLLHEQNTYSGFDDASHPMLLEKRLIKARVLMQHGVYQRSEQHLSRIVQIATEAEDFEMAIRAQRSMISITALHKDSQKFTKYFKTLDDLEYLNAQKNRAIRLFQELRIRKQRQLLENMLIFLSSAYSKLEESSQKAPSKTLEFIRLYFLKEKLEFEGDPGGSIAVLNKLQDAAPIALSNYLISGPMELFYEMARLLFSTGNSWSAEFFLQKCVRRMKLENYSYHRSLELLFFLYHHQDLEAKRNAILNLQLPELLQSDSLSTFDHCKWLYYRACVALNEHNAHACLKDIDRIYHLDKPENSLNLHLRMLRITAFIESQLFDHADRDIEASRKFINRNKLEEKMIQLQLWDYFEALKALKKTGYQFEQLSLNKPIFFKPKALGFTLFNYADWLAMKMRNPRFKLTYLEDRRNHLFEQGIAQPIYL